MPIIMTWSGRLTIAACLCLLSSRASPGQTPVGQDARQEPAAADQAADQEDESLRYRESVEVVGVTPIHGLGVPIAKVPSNVQVATAADLSRRAGAQVTDVLTGSFASVHVNEAQTNPFQPDIQFRGFAASPLLGLSQGIAVYQDGVRINEPFGDTVNWDLLPTTAVATVNLMPGSNPLFGLNALGGALTIETKSGFTYPGHAARVSGGSFGRLWADIESGDHAEHLSYYVTLRVLAEDGWREFSPSRLRQLFGKAEWRNGLTLLGASMTAGANQLVGNGPAPVELLEENRAAVFTHPDRTKTSVGQVSLNGRRVATEHVTVEGMAFFRPSAVRTFNGDDTNYVGCRSSDLRGLLCTGRDGAEPVKDQFGRPIQLGADPLDATNHTSFTRTRGWGGAIQATVTRPLARRDNHFIAGFSLDEARSRYEADTEIARLTDQRSTIGTGLLDSEAAVRVRTSSNHAGLYAADFFSVTPRLTLTGSARYTHSAVRLRDEIGDDLTGDHGYSRLNPAAGATFQVSPLLAIFGSYSEASRVPTPSELSCADPDDPCRLPNAFAGDPPLNQVVARTFEAGLRGRSHGVGWSVDAFRTRNTDDILFISSGSLTNEGHFENVGDTLREGIELMAHGTIGRHVRWSGAYTHLRATFDTPLKASSPNHPDAEDGEIFVPAGARLPGIPRQTWKAGVSLDAGRAAIDASLVSDSSQFFRGDEANLMAPIDGWFVVNLSGRYTIRKNVALSAHVANLFDAGFSTFGLLGEADNVLGAGFEDTRFVSPGAPRAAWVGVEFTFR